MPLILQHILCSFRDFFSWQVMPQNSVLWPLQFPLGYSAILFECTWRPEQVSSDLPLVLQHILCSFRDFFSWQVMPQNSVLWPLQFPLGYSAILFECTWRPLSSSWRQVRRPGLLCRMIVDDVCLSKLLLTHNLHNLRSFTTEVLD